MRTIQKCEFGFGIATAISVFILFSVFVYFVNERKNYRDSYNDEGFLTSEIILFITLFVFWLFSFLIAVGTYHHVKGSDMGASLVNVGGAVTIIFLCGLGFLSIITSGSAFVLAIHCVPATLAAITMFITSSNREKDELSTKIFDN